MSRNRVKDYHIYATDSQVIVRLVSVPENVVLEKIENSNELTPASTRRVAESIRLIVDETIGEVFCSSMQKSKIRKVYGSVSSMGVTSACAIEFAQPVGKTVNATDQFTIEMDWGDETAQESTLLAESEAIKQAIAAGVGGGITLATEDEYSSFKDEIQTKINDILSEGL